jgi:hypothetical protein
MTLRRITKHVKDQNWFAVGLDFLIVVFGVFMGFQVQQWNEDFSDKVVEPNIFYVLMSSTMLACKVYFCLGF